MNFAWSLKIYGWHKVIPLCWSVGRHVEVLSHRCHGEKMGKIWIWKILNGKYLKKKVWLLLHSRQSKYFQLFENLQLGAGNCSYLENLGCGTLVRASNTHLSLYLFYELIIQEMWLTIYELWLGFRRHSRTFCSIIQILRNNYRFWVWDFSCALKFVRVTKL